MSEEVKGLEVFAETERLIVVAAHPDDLETLCGGTVTLLAQRGVTIFSANCTLGDIGAQDPTLARPALARTRLAEADEAALILGISQTFNLGHHDGELVPDLNLRAQIARLFRVTQPVHQVGAEQAAKDDDLGGEHPPNGQTAGRDAGGAASSIWGSGSGGVAVGASEAGTPGYPAGAAKASGTPRKEYAARPCHWGRGRSRPHTRSSPGVKG